MKEQDAAARAEVMAKIAKLLRVTPERGASQQEAETAARIAQQLLTKWQLSIFDIASGEVGESVQRTDLPLQEGWQAPLLQQIGKAFNCRAIRDRGEGRLYLFGHESDVQVVIYFFVYSSIALMPECLASARRARARATAKWKYNFFYAAGEAIRKRLHDEAVPVQTHADERALVVAKSALVDKAVNAEFSNLGYSRGVAGDSRATAAGRNAGEGIALRRGVAGGGAQRQIEHK